MKPAIFLLAVVTCCGIGSNAQADLLADTQADFSTAAQGTNGFQYGAYTAVGSTTGPFSTANFVTDGTAWFDSTSSGFFAGTPYHDVDSLHPSVGPGYAAVRRYTVGSGSELAYAGLVQISGTFFDQGPAITAGFITVDGLTLYGPTIVPNSGTVSFNFSALVALGSTIDFGVNFVDSPFGALTGLGVSTINTVPEASSLLALGLAACVTGAGRWLARQRAMTNARSGGDAI